MKKERSTRKDSERLTKAEEFVRKALARSGKRVNEKTVRSVALKVSRAVPPYGDRGHLQA
jgi:hypothetical protein